MELQVALEEWLLRIPTFTIEPGKELAWAGGQIVGAAGGGALAKLSGDGAPTIAAAALCGATALALTVGRSAPAPRPSRPR